MASSSSDTKKKEIYTYEAPWTTYAMGWCRRPDGRFRMAVGSYKEEYSKEKYSVTMFSVRSRVAINPITIR